MCPVAGGVREQTEERRRDTGCTDSTSILVREGGHGCSGGEAAGGAGTTQGQAGGEEGGLTWNRVGAI